MNVPQFIDHVVMMMRNEGYERDGWDDNCIRVAAEGKDRIVVAFEDGSEVELTARSTTTDLRQAGVRCFGVSRCGSQRSDAVVAFGSYASAFARDKPGF